MNVYLGISDRHLLQRRHQYLLLLGPDADGRVRHSVADAVHHGNDGDRVSERRLQHLRRHGLSSSVTRSLAGSCDSVALVQR